MKRKDILLILLTFLFVTVFSSFAFAYSNIRNDFWSMYPQADIIDSCDNCHLLYDAGGARSRNAYGKAIEAELAINGGDNFAAFAAIEAIDSDGDGFSNIDEINVDSFPGYGMYHPGSTCSDADWDYYSPDGGACGEVDCNDSDGSVSPHAPEWHISEGQRCGDGIDNNCDGLIDFADPECYCMDQDNDGYPAGGGGECGEVDCVDWIAAINPGAVENCSDSIDNDCNGLTDAQDPACGATCTDADSDGYSIEGGACGAVDCDDVDPAVYPGAVEICDDGIDNDCNGLTDTLDPFCAGTSCTDADADGYNVEGGACGAVDCDDSDAAVNPGAEENCTDGVDNDCDGLIDTQDPSAVGCPPACTDADGDSYNVEGGACGAVDCDDNDAAINPGATESCDGVDNNCDGTIDEGCAGGCDESISVERFEIDCDKEKLKVRATSDTQPDAQPLTFIIYDGNATQQFPASGSQEMSWRGDKDRYEYKEDDLGSFLEDWDDDYYVIIYSQDCPTGESSPFEIEERKDCD